jgi:hypothetical protein
VADESRVPSGIDVNTPNVARMWDFQLGGKDNFAADRAAAENVNEAMRRVNAPDGRVVAKENRAFLQRAVRYLAGEAQIKQFLDIGAGLPTQGNVHQAAHEVAPDARVVYVDYDPVVVVHGQALLTGTDKTTVMLADLRQPEKILDDPELRRILDLGQPVALLLVAVLHLLTDDDDPIGIVTQLRDTLTPGSYLVVTHATRQTHPNAANALADQFKRLRVTTPIVPRSREEILRFFDGFELVEPGLVFPKLWHAEAPTTQADAGSAWMFAGVGRKL